MAGELGPPPERAIPDRTSRPGRVGLALRLATLFASLLVGLALGELGLRLFCRSLDRDERSLLYRYHARLGWFPVPNSRRTVTISRTFTAIHNRDGFRGPDRAATQKPVVVFLGDSFVWGLDVEAPERFTDRLQAKHPEWAVYNLGVSGYGTDQEYMLLHQFFDDYKPRVVFLVFCVENDDSDNSWNCRWGYYKPYVTVTGTRLQLKGIPVPRGAQVFCAEHPFLCRWYVARLLVNACYAWRGPQVVHNPNPTGPILRDLQKYVQTKGATLVMGLTHSHPHLEEFLRSFNIPYVDLSTSLRYPGYGGHWTPQGHSLICARIDDFLTTGNFLEPAPATLQDPQIRGDNK